MRWKVSLGAAPATELRVQKEVKSRIQKTGAHHGFSGCHCQLVVLLTRGIWEFWKVHCYHIASTGHIVSTQNDSVLPCGEF